MSKRILMSTVALVASATLLTACGSDAQNGEFPLYGKDEAYDLTNAEEFADFVKEYSELPDDYMEEVIESFNDSEKHDITLKQVESAGKEVCGNDDAKLLVGSFLGLFNGGYDDAADDYDDRDVEDALQPAADKLDIPVREDDTYWNVMFAAGLGAINECEKEFTGAQLEGAGGWFSLGVER